MFDNSNVGISKLLEIGWQNPYLVKNHGPWDGRGVTRDIYADILDGMKYLDQQWPTHLIVSEFNYRMLTHMNSRRITFYDQIAFLFKGRSASCGCKCHDVEFLQVAQNMPDDLAMLVAVDEDGDEHVVLISTV